MKTRIICSSLILTFLLVSNVGALSWYNLKGVASDGKFKFTATSIVCGAKSYTTPDGYLTVTAQGVYCRLGVTIKNIGKSPQMLNDTLQVLNSRSGGQYSPDENADIDLNPNSMWSLKTLNPGLSMSGYIYYDLPRGIRISSITVHDSAFSAGAKLNLMKVGAHSWL